uniref:Rho-GAP domain-containing protein n=2 Tax=Panagrolaimus sp. JU765 TaxID=591449 RepID=A0AC34R879_9BILA
MPEDQPTEWIEIIDPKSRQRMFANLVTGHCAWEPPPGVNVKRMKENQWWELFDSNTRRQYYYNPMTTETIWQRPIHGDIIPLARLQLLKQNTEMNVGELNRPSGSSSSTPRTRRKVIDVPTKSSELSSDFHYSNFCNELANQLAEIPTSSNYYDARSNGSSLQRNEFNKKSRAPSTCSSRSQASTKSRYNNCIQEMLASQCMQQNETTPILLRNGQSSMTRNYSPTSSLSSCGQSNDMVSQNTSFIAKIGPKTSSSTPIPMEKIDCWSKDMIKHALLDPSDKKLKKPATQVFKLVLSYMGDRKSKSVPEQTALSIVEMKQKQPILTDEIFLQIMKQLTENPKPDSIRRGWELLGILLVFFVPSSPEIHQKVVSFVESNSDSLLDSPEVSVSQYAKHCLKRLQTPINNLKPSVTSIIQARFNIFNPSKFGTTLEELMEMQAQTYPDLKIPWIESTLIKLIMETGGDRTEGLFRIAADPEQLQTVMAQLDQNIKPKLKDPHVPAVLLKQWLRQLPSPLIPDSMYQKCLIVCSQPDNACRLVDQLPAINRLVLSKLVHLLQILCNEEIVKITKMDVSNLAMIMAPNILRCGSEDPQIIFGNSRKEMEFMKILIQHYDTTFVHSIE